MTRDRRTPEEIVQEQAQQLGGNWMVRSNDLVPVVVLTAVEAEALSAKMKKKAPHDGLLAVRYTDQDDIVHYLPPDRVDFVYETYGI
jgi:hypothetical protein